MARKFFVPAAPGLGVNVNPPAGTLSLTGQVPAIQFPPSIPTGLAANALTNTTIGLSWNPSTDVGGPGLQDYRVYRNGVVVGTAAPASPFVQYVDSGLTPATTYTYTVTARDLNSVESAQSSSSSAQTQGGGSNVTLTHGQNFVFTGTNMTLNNGFLVWDHGQDGVGNKNALWAFPFPSGATGNNNIQNQASPFNTGQGYTFTAPFPQRVANMLTGCPSGTLQATGTVQVSRQQSPPPALPAHSIFDYWYRVAGNWTFQVASNPPLDDKFKPFVWTGLNTGPLSGAPTFATGQSTAGGPSTNTGGWGDNTTLTYSSFMEFVNTSDGFVFPDVNGHNAFWSGLNPAAQWVHVTQLTRYSRGNDGYMIRYENGQRVQNYLGPTYTQGATPTTVNEAIGGVYIRDIAATNFLAFYDIKYWNGVNHGRIVLTDNPVYASSTKFALVAPVSQNTSSDYTGTIDGGELPSGSQVWAYYVDESTSTVQPLMTSTTFTIKDQFDFFVSPTGVDTNLGTQASPWSMNAVNTKPQIAGKRLGFLDGTYVITGTGTGNGGYILSVTQGGPSPSQPTFIGSVNPRGAIITTNNGGSYPQATAAAVGINANNVVWDGFQMQQFSFSAVLVNGSNVTVSNVNGVDCNGPARFPSYWAANPGDNMPMFHTGNGANNVLFTNCHGKTVRNGNHLHNECVFGPFFHATNITVEYCTAEDAGCGIYFKLDTSGYTVRNCYVATTCTVGMIAMTYASARGALPSVAYNNIFSSVNASVNDSGDDNSWANVDFHNNTVLMGPSAATFGTMINFAKPTAFAGTVSDQFYNNIWKLGTSPVAVYVFQSGQQAANTVLSVLDYNCYPLTNFSMVDHGGSSQSTLAAWKTYIGKDANAISTDNPLFVSTTPVLPADFKLQATSQCKGAGKIGGVPAGAATDMGAWGGLDAHTGAAVTQIGSTF